MTTAARILEVARELLEAKGAEAVSMRRVAGAVGITAMAVYRHYADRDALLNALADEGFATLSEQLRQGTASGTFEERLYRALDLNLDLALAHPHLFELMFLRTRKGARQFPADFAAGKSPTGNVFAELVEEGMRKGVFVEGDVWEIVFEVGALFQGLVMLYIGGRMAGGPEEFRKVCHRAVGRYMYGIRKAQ